MSHKWIFLYVDCFSKGSNVEIPNVVQIVFTAYVWMNAHTFWAPFTKTWARSSALLNYTKVAPNHRIIWTGIHRKSNHDWKECRSKKPTGAVLVFILCMKCCASWTCRPRLSEPCSIQYHLPLMSRKRSEPSSRQCDEDTCGTWYDDA